MKKYSLLKVVRAQWSWNNDKWIVYMFAVLSVLLSLIRFYTGTITNTLTGEVLEVSIVQLYPLFLILLLVSFLVPFIFYHTAKLVIMFVVLGGLVYFIHKGKDGERKEAKLMYDDVMTWRNVNKS